VRIANAIRQRVVARLDHLLFLQFIGAGALLGSWEDISLLYGEARRPQPGLSIGFCPVAGKDEFPILPFGYVFEADNPPVPPVPVSVAPNDLRAFLAVQGKRAGRLDEALNIQDELGCGAADRFRDGIGGWLGALVPVKAHQFLKTHKFSGVVLRIVCH